MFSGDSDIQQVILRILDSTSQSGDKFGFFRNNNHDYGCRFQKRIKEVKYSKSFLAEAISKLFVVDYDEFPGL
jgi:hypothetical protein